MEGEYPQQWRSILCSAPSLSWVIYWSCGADLVLALVDSVQLYWRYLLFLRCCFMLLVLASAAENLCSPALRLRCSSFVAGRCQSSPLPRPRLRGPGLLRCVDLRRECVPRFSWFLLPVKSLSLFLMSECFSDMRMRFLCFICSCDGDLHIFGTSNCAIITCNFIKQHLRAGDVPQYHAA